MNGLDISVEELQQKVKELQDEVRQLTTVQMERGAALGTLYRSFREYIEMDFPSRKNELLTHPDPLVRNVAIYLHVKGRFPTSREFGVFNGFKLIDPVTRDS